MKLVTYVHKQKEYWGFILHNPNDDRDWVYNPGLLKTAIVEVATAHPTHSYNCYLPDCVRYHRWPDTLTEFLEQEEAGMEALRQFVCFMEGFLLKGDQYAVSFAGAPLEEVKLRAPIPRPSLFMGLVRNCPAFYRNKLENTSVSLLPIMHQRPITSIIGHNDVRTVYPENLGGGNVELGFVIGKYGKNIPITEAHKYVAGYFVVIDDEIKGNFNKMTQKATELYGADQAPNYIKNLEASNCGLYGKSSDARCAAGPYLVTADEVGNPYDLIVATGHSNMQRDRSHTAALNIGVERLIAWYSTIAAVHPGDVFHLGTAGTDGLKLTKEMRLLPDQTMYSEIENVGRLQIRVVGTPEDLQKELDRYDHPYIPALDDLVKSGKTEIAKPEDWKLEDMHNIWISMYNHKNCAELDNYPTIAPYPKAFNSPRKSVGLDGGEIVINKRATTLYAGVELAFVTKKVAHAGTVTPENFNEYILGYTPVISVRDRSIREEYDVGAIDLISGGEVHRFVDLYGRWTDGSNIVKRPQPLEDVTHLNMRLQVEGFGEATANTGEYVHFADKYLEFITHLCTLLPGDIITMSVGSARIEIPEGADIDGKTITAEIEGLGSISATLRREA